jgi:hypothetical protein
MDNFLDLRDGYRGHSLDGLTICYQYYDDQIALNNLLEVVETYPAHIREKINIQIVDDCSLKYPLRDLSTRLSDLGIRAYEIKNDIPWNQAGARNLNAYLAKTKWCLFSDIDHFFDKVNLEKLLDVQNQINEFSLYHIPRQTQKNEHVKEHVNTYLIAKNTFVMQGGIDEDFVGQYGYEDKFFVEEAKLRGCKLTLLDSPMITVLKHKSGNQLEGLQRDTSRNEGLYRAKFNRAAFRSYLALRFSYQTIC